MRWRRWRACCAEVWRTEEFKNSHHNGCIAWHSERLIRRSCWRAAVTLRFAPAGAHKTGIGAGDAGAAIVAAMHWRAAAGGSDDFPTVCNAFHNLATRIKPRTTAHGRRRRQRGGGCASIFIVASCFVVASSLHFAPFPCFRFPPGAMAAARDAGWLAVSKLSNAAMKMFYTGHFAHAANKFGDALSAARALGDEDCLVVASLALHRAQNLRLHAAGAGVSSAEKDAALEEAYEQILPTTTQALARRAAARTLLEGAVRPHEHEWYCAHLAHVAFTRKGLTRGEWVEFARTWGTSHF
jgi:hypothetical protein